MTIFLMLTKISFFLFDEWVLQMLYYDRIDISEGIVPAKSNDSKEFICHCWFFSRGLIFQNYVYNGCHDLTILYFNIRDTSGKRLDNHFINHGISTFDAICLLENSVLVDCGYIYKNAYPRNQY